MTVHLYPSNICWVFGLTLTTAEAWVLLAQIIYSFSSFSLCLSFFKVKYVPDSSTGKESTCNAGDPASIPGSGRFTGKGIGYPLQYSWASLVVQLVESACNQGDLCSVPELGRSPGEGNGYPHSILVWRIPWTVHGVAKSRIRLSNFRVQDDQAGAG